jgi:Uncharacterized conserved protein
MTTMTTFLESRPYRNEKLLLLAQIIGGSLLIALCAQIRIPLPFTPVPLTLQTLAVMVLGARLGSKQGALTVLLYLTEVMCGLPVLAGGRVDMLALVGPTGGYLIGFVFLAYITGWFSERKERFSSFMLLAGILLANVVMLSFGAAWLGQFVGMSNAFMMGVVPFIPGDILKALAVCTLLKKS